MTHYDWWGNLNPFEKSAVREHEKEIDRKEKLLTSIQFTKGLVKTKEKLKLEIAGHRFFIQQLTNRGIQRAKLGSGPRMPKGRRRIGSLERRAS